MSDNYIDKIEVNKPFLSWNKDDSSPIKDIRKWAKYIYEEKDISIKNRRIKVED